MRKISISVKRNLYFGMSTFSYNVRLCITTNACILVQSHVSGLDIRTAWRHEASIKDARDCWSNSHALCEFCAHTSEAHAHLKRTHTHTHIWSARTHTHTHIWSARTHTHTRTHLKLTHTHTHTYLKLTHTHTHTHLKLTHTSEAHAHTWSARTHTHTHIWSSRTHLKRTHTDSRVNCLSSAFLSMDE